jgi:hypothetical protein
MFALDLGSNTVRKLTKDVSINNEREFITLNIPIRSITSK